MKKRWTAVGLLLALALGVLPVGALAAPPALSGTAGENVTWTVDISTAPNGITFSGTGPMTDYTLGATRTESISAGGAAPTKGAAVPLTGTPNSQDPSTAVRAISSVGTDPDTLGGRAYASTQTVEVDGKAVEFQMYALKDAHGNDTNYVKLRDVALTVNGTKAQCSVDWQDGYVTVATQTAYKANGSEMKTPFTGDRDYGASKASP